MFKKALLLGISSGILAGVAGIIFEKVYATAFYTDFSTTTATFGSIAVTTSPMTIMLACIFTGVLAAVCFTLFTRWFKQKADAIFSLVFTIVSFASIVLPISAKLPLDLDEYTTLLFPSFVITLHFFPVLSWLTLKPFFFGKR